LEKKVFFFPGPENSSKKIGWGKKSPAKILQGKSWIPLEVLKKINFFQTDTQ